MTPTPALAAFALLPLLAPLPPLPSAPPRPRDPWVFRSVLDRRPRVVTVLLHSDLALAYDATTCALFEAWRGDVSFDGAVFTTVHGPQPTHRGVDVLDPLAGGRWKLVRGDVDEDVTPIWRGYRFADGHVTLEFDLRPASGAAIHVTETPEFTPVTRVLERRFHVDGLPDGASLALDGAPAPLHGTELLADGDVAFTHGPATFAPDADGVIGLVVQHRLVLTNEEHRLRVHHVERRAP